MNKENSEKINEKEITEKEEKKLDEAKLSRIVNKILNLEQEAINNNFNDEEIKKKIMKMIKEELECY